ncbi:MFS transporter [Gracilibacillus salitolerans]|uniref:MFS transporter n=1 Tax=Gracilibacillus salitolerans TaxID=2663022 RepID=A0A5Q2TFY8_9BACI|nr:MFS transporter [Gracilibacillus salitolerans]QGH32840.1 MFS transporter [Gracilibacillus salitolerans]
MKSDEKKTNHIPPQATWREWLGLTILTLLMLVLSTDLTALYLAMPSITADLQTGSTQMLWILHIYGFLTSGLLITMGRLGDRIGRRRMLLIGAVGFAVFSVLAAFSVNAELLIISRALLGVAGAMLMPSIFSLLRNMFHHEGQRRFAIAVVFSAFSAGGAVGPLLGGILLETFWWGAIFLINVPVLILFLVTGRSLLPEFREKNEHQLDWKSVALSLGGVLTFIYGIQGIALEEQDSTIIYVMAIVIGIILAVMFVRRQSRLAHPLLDLKLFTNRLFSTSLGAIFFTLIGLSGVFYLFTQYLQWVQELPPLQAGIWTLPYVIANIAGALIAPILVRWIRQRVVIWVSLLLVGVSLILIAVGASSMNFPLVVMSISLAGLTQGSAFALASDFIISSVPVERAGSASAMQEVSGELGNAMGVALLGTIGLFVYRSVLAGNLSKEVPTQVTDTTMQSVAGAIAASKELSSPMGMKMLDTVRDAFTQGFQVSSGIGGVLISTMAIFVMVLYKRSHKGSNL